MPTYLYKCLNSECVGEFEEYHSISIKIEKCPHCIAAGRGEQTIERLINGGGSGKGIVELTGRDLIDKTKADAQAYKKEVYGSEQKYASIVGENRYQEIQQRMDKQRR